MVSFRAFGLSFFSDTALPGLPPLAPIDTPDVRWTFVGDDPAFPVEERQIYPPDAEAPTFSWIWRRTDESLRVLCAHEDEYLEFLIDSRGDHIRIASAEKTPDRDAVPYLLGSVMGFILRRRGLCSLHGGAVGVDGRAIVVIGPSGTGKSSTVAALAERGHKVLTDDIAIVETTPEGYQIRSSYPAIRLRTAYVEAAMGSADALPRLWSDVDGPRHDRRLSKLDEQSGQFQPTPLPLQAVVVLAPRGAPDTLPSMAPLPSIAGTLSLLANTHVSFVLSAEEREREWAFLGEIARTVPMYRLSRPDSVDALPHICNLIEEIAAR